MEKNHENRNRYSYELQEKRKTIQLINGQKPWTILQKREYPKGQYAYQKVQSIITNQINAN